MLRKQPQTKKRLKMAQPPPGGHIQVPAWCQVSWNGGRLRSRSRLCWPEGEQGSSKGREWAGEELCRGAAPQRGDGLLPAPCLLGRRETPTPQARNLLPKQSRVLLLVEGRDQGSWKGLAAPSLLQPFAGMAEIPCSLHQEPLAKNEPKSSF